MQVKHENKGVDKHTTVFPLEDIRLICAEPPSNGKESESLRNGGSEDKLETPLFRWQCYRAGEVILDTKDPMTADRVGDDTWGLQNSAFQESIFTFTCLQLRKTIVSQSVCNSILKLRVTYLLIGGVCAVQATSLHILVEGIGKLTANREREEPVTSLLYSGYIFDLAICNAFGVYIGLERAPIMYATAGEKKWLPGKQYK